MSAKEPAVTVSGDKLVPSPLHQQPPHITGSVRHDGPNSPCLVEGALLIRAAIGRMDLLAARPREISSAQSKFWPTENVAEGLGRSRRARRQSGEWIRRICPGSGLYRSTIVQFSTVVAPRHFGKPTGRFDQIVPYLTPSISKVE